MKNYRFFWKAINSLFLAFTLSSCATISKEEQTRIAEQTFNGYCEALKSKTGSFPDGLEQLVSGKGQFACGIEGHYCPFSDLEDEAFFIYQRKNKLGQTLLDCASLGLSARSKNSSVATVRFQNEQALTQFKWVYSSALSNPFRPDSTGRTAYDYASKNGDEVVVAFFRSLPGYKNRPNPFNQYCSKGRQIKGMKANLIAELNLSALSDEAVDTKSDRIEDAKKASRQVIKNLFSLKLSTPHYNWLFLEGTDESLGETPESLLKRKGIKLYQGKKEIYPDIHDISPLKAVEDFIEKYTFNIPKSDQQIMFKKRGVEDYGLNPECVDQGDGFVGLDSSCTFKPSKAISNKDRAYAYYFYRFASVKEAPTNDSNKTAFEVSINLEPFCKYAVAIEDLKAK